MPTHQATVTGVVGPGKSITSSVFKGITEVHLYMDKKYIQFSAGGVLNEIEIASATTFTVTISGGAYTLSIS